MDEHRPQAQGAGDDVLTPVDLVTEQVRLLAWRRRLSQQQLADALGVSQSTLSKKLHGQVTLTVAELLCLADVLDVDARELLPRRRVLRRAASQPMGTPRPGAGQ